MYNEKLKAILEAALLAAGGSLSLDRMLDLFEEDSAPEKKQLREALEMLSDEYEGRGMQLTETGSGWRIQVRAQYAEWVSRLWEEKPARYSRALLETLALIAYRQPITRGEIEEVRGVSVSSNIIKTLQERDWIRVVGHRDVPGRPALYATSKVFLDYFNLKSLNDLPSLAEIRDLDSINNELELSDPDKPQPEGDAVTQKTGSVIDGDAMSDEHAMADAQESEETGPEEIEAEGNGQPLAIAAIELGHEVLNGDQPDVVDAPVATLANETEPHAEAGESADAAEIGPESDAQQQKDQPGSDG